MEKQPLKIYTSDFAATDNIIKQEPVEVYSLDPVKTKIVIKNEHKIEINSADVNLNSITTKEQLVDRFLLDSASKTTIHKNLFVETYFSNSGDANKCIRKKRSTKDLKLEDIMNESSEDDVFSEGDSDENNTEDVDMIKIKMEDTDIEPNNIDVERNLTIEALKVENSDDENNIVENHKLRDSIEDHTYAKKTQEAAWQTDTNDNNRDLLLEEDMNENCYNNEFPEGCSDENNTEDIDVAEIKIEDVDIKPNIINMNRYEEKPNMLQCSYCNFKSSCGNLTNQLKTIHGKRLLNCRQCGYRTHSEDFLKKHQVIHGNKAKFQCPQCQKVFSSKMSIDNHFLMKHDDLCDAVTSKINSCNICSFKTTSKTNLSEHINSKHLRLKQYKCSYCLYTFVMKASLRQHISSVHLNLRPYVCNGCKKTFNHKVNLYSHIVSCHQTNFDLMKTVTNKIYNCDHCAFKCIYNSVMQNHIKTHNIHLLSCHHCNYKTSNEVCLKKHQVIHGNNAKFKCPQCQKCFNKRSNMDNHFLRKHDNLSDLVTSNIHLCNICDFKTTKKSNLFRHINTKHSRLEKYQCNYCLRSFVLKQYLKRHISSVHLNLRPYICKGCKKAFNLKLSLDSHIVSCHQTNFDLMKTVTRKINNCDHCTFKCILNSAMKSHVKTHGKHV